MVAAVRLYVSLESRYLKPHLLRVLTLAVMLLAGIALSLTAPQFVRHFIDTAQEQGSIATLYIAAGLFLGVSVVTELTSAGASYFGNDVAWRATNKMRSDLLLHVLNLDLSFHNSHTPGELIQRIDEDVNRLSNFFSQFVIRTPWWRAVGNRGIGDPGGRGLANWTSGICVLRLLRRGAQPAPADPSSIPTHRLPSEGRPRRMARRTNWCHQGHSDQRRSGIRNESLPRRPAAGHPWRRSKGSSHGEVEGPSQAHCTTLVRPRRWA